MVSYHQKWWLLCVKQLDGAKIRHSWNAFLKVLFTCALLTTVTASHTLEFNSGRQDTGITIEVIAVPVAVGTAGIFTITFVVVASIWIHVGRAKRKCMLLFQITVKLLLVPTCSKNNPFRSKLNPYPWKYQVSMHGMYVWPNVTLILHNRSTSGDSERPDTQPENSSVVPIYSHVQVPVVREAFLVTYWNCMLLVVSPHVVSASSMKSTKVQTLGTLNYRDDAWV